MAPIPAGLFNVPSSGLARPEVVATTDGDGKFTLDVQQPNVVHCFNIDEYRQCLAAALSVDALSTVMFSNHRTYQLDLELAEQSGVPTAVIFRQTPIADEALRTLASPVSAELTYLHGDELDWDSLHRAATMPLAEQRERMASLRMTVRENNVFRWAGHMLTDAGRSRLRERIEARVQRHRAE